jgi:hypothetical protein
MANSWRNSIRSLVLSLFFCGVATGADLRLEIGSAPPPSIRAGDMPALAAKPLRVIDGRKLRAQFWFATTVEKAKTAGDRVSYRFAPFAAVGVIELAGEWSDYRGTAVPAGTYLLRYAVQPPLKDHMGVSTFRDFLILEPAKGAREGHPYVMALVPPSPGASPPAITRSAGDTIVEWTLAGERVAFVLEGRGQAPEL